VRNKLSPRARLALIDRLPTPRYISWDGKRHGEGGHMRRVILVTLGSLLVLGALYLGYASWVTPPSLRVTSVSVVDARVDLNNWQIDYGVTASSLQAGVARGTRYKALLLDCDCANGSFLQPYQDVQVSFVDGEPLPPIVVGAHPYVGKDWPVDVRPRRSTELNIMVLLDCTSLSDDQAIDAMRNVRIQVYGWRGWSFVKSNAVYASVR
jgi:hypothetical protein